MKKLISLMLAVLMVALCACGIAEETKGSGDTAFVQIKEGVTAKVFKEPGGEEAVDTLPGGRICGLLDEGTTEAGAAWFQVFYLNSQKKGTVGYINAEDAEKLIGDQLKALMEDPAILNEILDLIDELDHYLGGTKDENPEKGNETPEKKNKLKELYNQAMDKLKKLFNADLSAELGNLKEEGKELADKAKEVGKDLLDKAKDTGKDLVDKAKDTGKDLVDKAKDAGDKLEDTVKDVLPSLKDKDIGDMVDSLKDRINDAIGGKDGKSDNTISDILDKASDALKNMDSLLGTGAGNTVDGLSDIVNNAKDWLDGPNFSKIEDAMKNLSEQFKDGGFAAGWGKEGIGSFVDEVRKIFSNK